VAVTKIKKELLENAKDINWTPEHIKEGRWGKWLEGGRDWSISRQRFWASVMPIWKCQGIKSKDKSQKSSDGCGHTVVFGSTAEIEKKLGTFFVMRHGEAEHNVKGILSGQLNDGFNLTDNGVKSVKKAAEKLISKKIDLIISSDIDRAAQTSKIISDTLGVKIIYDERLREVNMGDYDKKKQKDVKSFLQDWSNLKEKIRFPNGDSWDSLKERIENFYNDLFTKYRDKNILIVSHGDTITSLRAVLLSGNYSNALKKVREEPYVKKAEPVEYGYKLINLHKHIVDKITFKCEKCGGEMRRVPDVLDTWFDSGSMPYGQAHYPFDNKEEFEKSFPADFIAEGIDQTRAWFYYLHIIAGGIFNKKAFKNVIVNGIVLAEDGQKMSKKLQNYPDPMEMVNKYGADPLKFYLAQSPVVNAQDLNFSEKDLAEIARGTFRMLWQSYSFFVMYANIDRWSVENQKVETGSQKNILDKWLISELHQLIKEVDEEMENYHLMQATRKFVPFVDNLSNWYIRRSRKRFWKSENDGDKNEAYATLHYVLVELSKTIAPFAPYLADEIYKNLTGGESVHLQDYPRADESLIDEKLNKQMQFVRDIISEGLKLRARTQIKVRQPLNSLKVESQKLKVDEKFIEIIKEELNIKEIVSENFEFDESAKNMGEINGVKLMLDTEIDENLKMEGQARELIRAIQQMRKEADYQLDDRIKVSYDGLSEVFTKFGDLIAKETLADELTPEELLNSDLQKEIAIDGENITLWIKQ
jgi:isoleucyl-tRNA synthetase